MVDNHQESVVGDKCISRWRVYTQTKANTDDGVIWVNRCGPVAQATASHHVIIIIIITAQQ